MGERVVLITGNVSTDWKRWPGGKGSFAVNGTVGGATVTVDFRGPSGDALVIATLTAGNLENFECAEGQIRGTITGGTPADLEGIAVQYRA